MNHGNRNSLFVLLLSFVALGTVSLSVPAYAAGTRYYIDNRPGSNCSDGGPHSMAQPWCTFTPINKIGKFSPGDQILLASGSTWDQQMTLAGSGTWNQPITLSSYGSGANPRVLRNQAVRDICILLTDPSYWNISNLEVGQASVGILLHYTHLSNNGIWISNVYAHDNKGIWDHYSTEHPVSGKKPDPFAASLNINLSSGILFNMSSSLGVPSSQYVLKGVSLNDIHGTNNVDSVAFDAEPSIIDHQDGHNAFQNVTLNGLFLLNDNGHAAPVYQAAGLGCSDSLRLLGMTNVTLLNSILYDEAACHTATGTAAVILGRVSNVTIANNIIYGVPASNSPDETGIDFEWSESHVDLHGNLLAGNAGAGVEILNIHPYDHSADLDFYDNTFGNNSRTYNPGGASIWEYCQDRAFGTPSGLIRDNLYTETKGSNFFAGGNIASVKNSDNLSISTVSNYAAEGFSSKQAKNQWRYMYQSSASTWLNIPYYVSSDNIIGFWEVSPSQYISAFKLAPAGNAGMPDTGGVARVWVAPRSGIISIRGRVLKSDAGGGSGVYAAIDLVSGKDVTRIWPAKGGKQLIAGKDQSGYSADVNNISVEAGDQVRFEVTANGDNAHDVVSWSPSVGYIVQAPRLARLSNLFAFAKLH
jgi:Periplasmic copper-binding protein (NosD)